MYSDYIRHKTEKCVFRSVQNSKLSLSQQIKKKKLRQKKGDAFINIIQMKLFYLESDHEKRKMVKFARKKAAR